MIRAHPWTLAALSKHVLGFEFQGSVQPQKFNVTATESEIWSFLKEIQMVHNYMVLFPENRKETNALSRCPNLRVDFTYDTWGTVKVRLALNLTLHYQQIYEVLKSTGKGDKANVAMVNLVPFEDPAGSSFEVPSKFSVYDAFADSTDSVPVPGEPGKTAPLKSLGSAQTIAELVQVAGSFFGILGYEDKAHYLALASSDAERESVRGIIGGVRAKHVPKTLSTIAWNMLASFLPWRPQPIPRVQQMRDLFAAHQGDAVGEKKDRVQRMVGRKERSTSMADDGVAHSCITFIYMLADALGARWKDEDSRDGVDEM